MINRKKTVFAATFWLTITIALTACGETSTAVPATTNPTTVSTTSSGAAITTSSTPALASTTNSATAITTSSTPALATTTTALTSAATSGSTGNAAATLNLPTIPNTSEIQLNKDNEQQILKAAALPASLTNATVRIFVSNDDPATLATNADTALTTGGYTFGIPGQTKPVAQGDNTFGIYSKAGALDLLTVAADPTKAFANGSSNSGLDSVLGQIKNNKSLLLVVGANGMLKAIASGQSSGAATTPNATTTTK